MDAGSRGPRLVIIADDLTGALDAGVAFARCGLVTRAATSPEAIVGCLGDSAPDILAVSTRTRELSADAARCRVAAAMRDLPAGTPIFKKVDSRLKGPIAAELDEIPHEVILAMPAIPEFGRTVERGLLRGFGIDRPISVAACLGPHADAAWIPDILRAEDMDDWLARRDGNGVLPVGARTLADRAIAFGISDPQTRT